jgi:hypothetical protein
MRAAVLASSCSLKGPAFSKVRFQATYQALAIRLYVIMFFQLFAGTACVSVYTVTIEVCFSGKAGIKTKRSSQDE